VLAVPVQGQPQVQMAVQGRHGLLYEAGPVYNGLAGSGLGMLAGTTPALAENVNGGAEAAWVGANQHLWLLDPAGQAADTTLPADPGPGPAITALAGGGFEVAWVRGGQLWELPTGGPARMAGH